MRMYLSMCVMLCYFMVCYVSTYFIVCVMHVGYVLCVFVVMLAGYVMYGLCVVHGMMLCVTLHHIALLHRTLHTYNHARMHTCKQTGIHTCIACLQYITVQDHTIQCKTCRLALSTCIQTYIHACLTGRTLHIYIITYVCAHLYTYQSSDRHKYIHTCIHTYMHRIPLHTHSVPHFIVHEIVFRCMTGQCIPGRSYLQACMSALTCMGRCIRTYIHNSTFNAC